MSADEPANTPDKPDVQLVPYEASSAISSFMSLRVADIDCYMSDPDGYEVMQATGLVEGRLAEQAPAGREAGRADGR